MYAFFQLEPNGLKIIGWVKPTGSAAFLKLPPSPKERLKKRLSELIPGRFVNSELSYL